MTSVSRRLALTLLCFTPVTTALALDYRVAAETRLGLGLVDADAVDVIGTTRRMTLTVVFPEQDGDPAEIGVASVLVDCEKARYRMESVIGYDTDLKEKYREDARGGWIAAEEGTPFFPASDFVCRGKALPPAESQDLKAIVDGYLRRAAGEHSI